MALETFFELLFQKGDFFSILVIDKSLNGNLTLIVLHSFEEKLLTMFPLGHITSNGPFTGFCKLILNLNNLNAFGIKLLPQLN